MAFVNRLVIIMVIQLFSPASAQNEDGDPAITESHNFRWGEYHTLEEIFEYLDWLGETYSSFVTVEELGRTFEKRPMKYVKIYSGKPNARAVFIDGGIHGSEWISIEAVIYIIRELVENRDELPNALKELDFYLLPVYNPDGFQYSYDYDREWRKNKSKEYKCFGTDLNRNFDFFFGSPGRYASSSDPCDDEYKGKYPASELETKAFKNFTTSIKRVLKGYISFQSYGQTILTPFGHRRGDDASMFQDMKLVAKEASLAMQSIAGKYYEEGPHADIDGLTPGTPRDWLATDLKVPYTYIIKLRDMGQYGVDLPERYIVPTSKEAFEAVKVISAAAGKASFTILQQLQ